MPSKQPIDLSIQCPSGHTIPHRTNTGECTPVRCAVDPNAKPVRSGPKSKSAKESERKSANIAATFQLRRDKAVEAATKALVKKIEQEQIQLPVGASRTLADEGRLEALGGASIAVGKKAARAAFTPDMPAPDADEVTINDWADKRVLKNLPQAIAEKEFQLHYGDDEQRDKAADTFLRMNGRHEKEGKLSGGALIVIQQGAPGSGGMQLPYMPKRVSASSAIVEAEVEIEKE